MVIHKPGFILQQILSVVIFLMPCFQIIQAQGYRFQHLTNEDGLSENSVMAIYLDHQGFLWFGTGDGLNRYDGYSFRIFKNAPGNSQSLGSNYVMSIAEDNENNLWLCTWKGGLNRFDHKSETFVSYGNQPGQIAGLQDNSALTVYHDSKNRFWVGTISGGLNLLDRESGDAVAFQHKPGDTTSLSRNVVTCIAEDRHGNLWVGTGGGGLNLLQTAATVGKDLSSAQFIRFQHDPANPNSLAGDAVIVILPDPEHDEILWIATREGGLCRMDTRSRTFSAYQHDPKNSGSLSSNQIYAMFFDSHFQLWIGTFGGGLNRLRRGEKVFSRFRHNPANPSSINDDKVISVAEDKSGNLWFGTHKAGVNKLNLQANQFELYRNQPGNPASIGNNFVTAIFEDRYDICWVGTQGGLFRLDRAANTVEAFRHDAQNRRSLSHDWVYAILEDSSGNLWVGSYGGGLNLLDRNSKKFTRYQYDPENPNGLNDDRLLALAEQGGYLWIGIRGGGLNRFDVAEQSFVHYIPDADDPNSLSDLIVRDILPHQSGELWLATNNGLNRFDPRTETFTHFFHQSEDSSSISDSRIVSLMADNADRIWVGTMNGLNLFHKNSGNFRRYYQEDGLPNNVIYAMLEDQQGHLWISTNNGLSRFSPTDGSFVNYDEVDGLQGNEFTAGAAFTNQKGELFFGGHRGLTVFDPTAIVANNYLPPVVITDFLLFNSSVGLTSEKKRTPLQQVISQTRDLTLSYQDKVFSFEFAALDYTAPMKNQYAYRLEGFDNQWIPADNRRFATYTNIDPGNYVFRVKASNNSGIWNNAGAAINITVLPPFWKTWWFRALMLLLFATALWLLYRMRVKSLLRIERTRTMIARDLHDELSATLSSINFFSQAIESKSGSSIETDSQKYLGLIEESSRVAQDKIHDIIWTIDTGNDTWEDVLIKCRRYSAELLESQEIDFRQEIPAGFGNIPIKMELRRNFWLIFKELVTNLARHSRAKSAAIIIRRENSSILLEITDDGIGFDPDLVTSRNGIKNIYARAKEIDAQVDLHTSRSGGTHWRISFRH